MFIRELRVSCCLGSGGTGEALEMHFRLHKRSCEEGSRVTGNKRVAALSTRPWVEIQKDSDLRLNQNQASALRSSEPCSGLELKASPRRT